MEKQILEWLCDFIIPLDIRGSEEIEKVYINGLTSEALQVEVYKIDGSLEIYEVKVSKI